MNGSIEDDGSDQVGKNKPPKKYRYKPGQSGNPKGRPKGVKRPSAILEEILNTKVTIREGQRTRTVTAYEAAMRSIAAKAVRGDIKASRYLTEELERARAIDPRAELDLTAGDQALLEQLVERRLASSSPELVDPED